jgi:membrane protein DedA with SNARE-associated domain
MIWTDCAIILGAIDTPILHFIRHVYDWISWPGIVLLMAIESACIPLPSEVIMPLAGWLLVKDRGLGWEWLFLAGFCGALGNTIGSLIAYYVGARGGRPFVEKYGKYILVSPHDLDIADRFFVRWGMITVFVSRLLPVVRTFISFPAGVSRMPISRFTLYSFAGSFPFSMALAAIGYGLGTRWEDIRTWMRPVEVPIVIVIVILVALYIYRHIRRSWAEAPGA